MTVKATTKTGNNGLFPDTWVVGEAAAELARDDEGVLLAPGIQAGREPAPRTAQDNSRPADAPTGGRTAVNPGSGEAAAREKEFAELHAENERLRRRIKLTRRYPGGPTQVVAGDLANPGGDPFADQAQLDGPGTDARERPRRRRSILVLALLVCLGLLAVSLPAERIEVLKASLPQQLQAWGDEAQAMAAQADLDATAAWLQESGQRLAARLSTGLQETWQALTAEPAGEVAETPPAPSSGIPAAEPAPSR